MDGQATAFQHRSVRKPLHPLLKTIGVQVRHARPVPSVSSALVSQVPSLAGNVIHTLSPARVRTQRQTPAPANCPRPDWPNRARRAHRHVSLRRISAIHTFDRARVVPSEPIHLVVMVTGDHPHTAAAVAGELGLSHAQRVVTGAELDAMSEDQLAREVSDIGVFARVSPGDKLRIVQAWQSRGCITAMTGDGVNDAPALKQADIGVAMGITGTDVSKEAAAMSLTDDNFASIVAAVEEGRGIYANIKKYLSYLLAANIGEICLVAGAAVLGFPLPLTAVQILYVNLATDGLPALALAVDPPADDLMRRPPRDPRAGIWTRPVVTLMIVAGGWSALVNVGLFAWALTARGLEQAMALVFVTLVLIEFAKAYAFRSERYSVVHRTFANKWLNRAMAWELLLLVAVVYSPWLQVPLGTFAFSVADWLLATGLAATVLPVLDLTKWMLRRDATEDQALASTVS